MNNHAAIIKRFDNLYSESSRNRYYWTLSSALYNLQFTAPKILLALKECDTPDTNRQKTGIENVKKAIMDFRQTWVELEAVYGQTRFVSYPANYIPDRYFHLASQGEDLTWMIQPEKLFIPMIEKWIQN
jgi:hexosaminidase